MEKGAGVAANYSDSEYTDAGATIGNRSDVMGCEIVISIRLPDVSELSKGQIIACVADPFRHPEKVQACIDGGITLMSMDMIPRRLSRAQSMDVNSSQDNLAGYKAVLLGASHVPRGIPMMTTSAGTVRPAKVVIMGSGVAGLQAIATAKESELLFMHLTLGNPLPNKSSLLVVVSLRSMEWMTLRMKQVMQNL